MVSSSLQTLREADKAQVRIYRTLKTKAEKIHTNPAFSPGRRAELISALMEETRGELAALQAKCATAKTDIEQKAAARKVQATPEARARVQRVIDRVGPDFSVGDLAKLLAEQGDRAGIAALHEELPYLALEGKLPGPKGDHATQIKHAQESILPHEQTLWDEGEQALHAEAREVSISQPLMAVNEKKLAAHIDRQLLSGAHQERIDSMYRWQGLPNDTSMPKGLLDLSDETVLV